MPEHRKPAIIIVGASAEEGQAIAAHLRGLARPDGSALGIVLMQDAARAAELARELSQEILLQPSAIPPYPEHRHTEPWRRQGRRKW